MPRRPGLFLSRGARAPAVSAGSLDERQERRERLLRYAVFSALACAVALPVYMCVASGEFGWAAVGAVILPASAASFAQVFLRTRRNLARARRLERMTGRIVTVHGP